MSFESEVKKMQKLWDEGQSNQNNFDYAQGQQFVKNQQIIDINTPPLTLNLLHEIGGDYIDIQSFQTTPYLVSGFVWNISKNLPETWIPLIRIDVEYNYTGQIGDFSNITTYYNKVLNLLPTSDNSGNVQANWQIGLYLVSYDPTIIIPDFQAKLLFTLIEPSNAV